MHVRVLADDRRLVNMIMMLVVVTMYVLVLDVGMNVHVMMVLGHVQPHADREQHG